jgi:hypothetical protein
VRAAHFHFERNHFMKIFSAPGGIALAAALLVGVGLFPLQAQDATGKIAGVVSDVSGGVVANARLTITNMDTRISKSAVSDTQGYYQVLQLAIGKYEVAGEAPGFQRVVSRPTAALEINQTLRVDLVMQVGSVSDTVTVDSASSIVETQNSTVGGTVTGNAIFELPLNGRNTLDLLQTQPGVTPTNPDSTASGTYSIGGGRTDSVTYLLDGGNNNNLLSNAVVMNPNPDAVAEFRVLESNYGAEYGRNAGGVVSVVTKSGSNSLHGTLYDYLRNDALNANTFFNNEQGLARPILKRNQFGGTIGGPIMIPKFFDGRNKLFFFFSYQGQRQTQLSQAGKVNTYTPLEAQGNFSQSVNGGPDAAVAGFLQANPYYQSNPSLAAQGIIDPAKIDPVALSYFKANLIPTSPSGFLFPQASAKANDDQYLGKFDYNISASNLLTGTFTARDTPSTSPFGNANVPGYTSSVEVKSYFGTVTYTHTFTPSLINEARVTAQRNNTLNATPIGSTTTPAQLGIGITPDQSTGPTLLGFQGSGLNIGFSPNGPTNLIDNTYAFYDNLSWVKGKHNLKAGFYFSPYQNNTVYDYYVNGEYFFYGAGGIGSGTDRADFLLGLPDEYLQFGKAPSNIRSKSYSGYVQDEWHATPRLTLTAGLRYEYAQPKFDTRGRSFSFVAGQQSTRFVNAPTGLLFPGDKGAPKGSNFSDKNDFAPRLGYAYDVFGNGKTSIRGGVGVFYDILKGEDNLQFNGQAPFFGFADIFFDPASATQTANPGYLNSPFQTNNTGTANSFPSRPPAANINFNDSGFLPFGGGGVYFVDPHLRTPYVFQYNTSIQQQLASNLVLEVGYVGYSAHKLTALVDKNPDILGTTNRVYGSNFSYLNEFQNASKANYNGLQTQLTKRFGGSDNSLFHGAFFTATYTWSHEIDNASGFRQRNSNIPYYNHNQFRTSGDTDVRHVAAISGGWELPFQKLWSSGPSLLTKGWSVYPITTFRSGFPIDITARLNTRRTDPGPSGAGDAGAVRADVNGKIVYYNPKAFQTISGSNNGGSASAGNYYFNPNVFSTTRLLSLDALSRSNPAGLVGQYTYGTLPRNSLRGPGAYNLNLAVAKHFYLGEKLDIELRGDMFNVLNHAEFLNPDPNIQDATFGQISGTSDPRIIQVALHLKF